MTASLFAIYSIPADKDDFDQHYFNQHLPIVDRMPGLQEVRVNKVLSNSGDPAYCIITELVFASLDELQSSRASDAGKEPMADLVSWGGDQLVSVYITRTD